MNKLNLTKGSDLKSQAIAWLWPGVLIRNAFGTLSGNPGTNKSTLSQDVGARISIGAEWPLSNEKAPVGNVIILSAEEDANYGIMPRLEAMNADTSRISILRKVDIGDFNISSRLDLLQGSIEDIGDVKLIIIDTLDSFLGDANTNNGGEVRDITTKLGALAEAHNICILGISHLNKDSSKEAVHRVAGSISWIGAGRFNWLLAKDKTTPDKRLLTGIKNNHGSDGDGYSFFVQDTIVGEDLELGKPITGLVTNDWAEYSGTAQELLEQRPGTGTKTGAAEDMILALLAMGRMGKDNLETIIKSEDISPGTLRVAIRNLQHQGLVDKEKDKGVHGSWNWKLKTPEQPAQDTPKTASEEGEAPLTPYLQRLKEAEDRRKAWAESQLKAA